MADYDELIKMLNYLADTPSYTAFHDGAERDKVCAACPAKGELCYGEETNEHWCMYEALSRAAQAIRRLQDLAGNQKEGCKPAQESKTRRVKHEKTGGCCDYASKQCQCRNCARQHDQSENINEPGCCDRHKQYTHDTKNGWCYIKGFPDFAFKEDNKNDADL